MSSSSWPRVAIVGAGAVGGYFGGMLARADGVAVPEQDYVAMIWGFAEKVGKVFSSTAPDLQRGKHVCILENDSPCLGVLCGFVRQRNLPAAIV
jgi:ketopantoate reductase